MTYDDILSVGIFKMLSVCFFQVFSLILLYHQIISVDTEAEVMHEFVSVRYDWNNETQRQTAIDNGDYIVENNIITGIKLYKDHVYVTVPRWRHGVPSTLNRVVDLPAVGDGPVLEPFPDWDSNTIGDCNAFQYVQSMEIDPNTGFMWIIDTGRVNTSMLPTLPANLCPPKLVILDLERSNAVMRSYEFPDHVVSHTSNFMNDIVLDYVDGAAKFAYITDTSDAKLYVYDFDENTSYDFQHSSMQAVPLIMPTQNGLVSAPIDGIAMSPDFRTVYYSALSALPVYSIPTEVLRKNSSDFDNNVRVVGNKTGGCDGMAYGQNHIFYAALEYNALYMASVENGRLLDQKRVVQNNRTAVWIDTLAFNGTDLWFVANDLTAFFGNNMNFTGQDSNIYIWKVRDIEAGYLQNARSRTVVNAVGYTAPN